jgi:Transglutaminase-like superfamily.
MKLFYYYFTALLFLYSTSAFGQREETRMKTVTKEELKIKEYSKDPLAEAYVIFDTGKTLFVERDGEWFIQYIRTSKIKILNNEGVKHAEISVPLYQENKSSRERLLRVEAYSYNLENEEIVMTTFDKNDVFEEVGNGGWIYKKFVIPSVKEGTVIEYRYAMETPYVFRLPDWEFQQKIPVKYSEYTVSVIPFYEYQYILKGARKFDYYDTKKEGGLQRSAYGIKFSDLTTVVAMKDLPAFRDESYISSIDDYIIKLDFQLSKVNRPDGSKTEIMTNWKDLREDYLSHDNLGDFIKKSRKPAEKILESSLVFTDEKPSMKVKKIIDFAKQEFKWNEFYGKFSTQSPKSLLSKKSGNVADINLFTIGLLRAAGIEANPVIISTRGHGKIEMSYPFASFFNYLIIQVELEEGMLLADATGTRVAFNRLPPRCINDVGLVINDAEKERWLYTNPEIPSKTITKIQMVPDPSKDMIDVMVIRQKTELDAYWSRRRIGENTERLKESLTEEHFSSVSDIKIKNYDKLRLPFVHAFNGEVEQEKLNDQLIFSPFLHYPPTENYFTEPNRTYPIDFLAPNYEHFSTEIMIPEGYEVDYLPEPFAIDDELVTFNATYAHQPQQNKISVIGIMNFKLGIYHPKYYRLLKEHIEKVVTALNDKIILQKIK